MPQSRTKADPIYSRLGGDPDLAGILDMFVEEMPKRAVAMIEHLGKGNLEGVRQIAHQIKGAAGSYGFETVSPAAGKVESAVSEGEPEEDIRKAVAELADLCNRLRSGRPS